MGSPLVRAAFAVIVGATIGAFFVTQRLKDEFPLVLRFAAAPDAISPNGDGFRDASRVGFDLSRTAKVSFFVVDSEGREVRQLVDERRLSGDRKYRFRWNGRDDQGRRLPDGSYRMRVVRRDEGRVINSIKKIRIDTKPPKVTLTSARPGVISPADPGRHTAVTIRYRGPRNQAPEFRIFRTDEGPPRVVARFRGDDRRRAVWRGSVRGRPAVDGDYTFTVTVRDKAGNEAVAPAAVPTAAVARRGTGVAVRHLTLSGPLTVLHPGGVARLQVGPYRHRFRFTLSRLGSRRPVARGKRTGGRFRVGIPRRSRSGLYLVRVEAGRRQAVWPLAVNRPHRGRRPLVVLPAMTWQGVNRVDDDLDGFADTLDTTRAVPLDRPFAGGRLPPRLGSETAPLLRFLDRARLPYDLTTDVSLASGSLPRARGVVLAGSARWLTPGLLGALRRYVDRGGGLASFGADALLRSVRLRSGTLRGPGAPRRYNALAERTRVLRAAATPLSVEEDRLDLFNNRFVGEFSIFDRSIGLAPGTRRLVAAGRDPGQPAFVVYRLGKGLVVRAGSPQWAERLSEPRVGGELGRVTRRIWSLIERG